MIFWYFVWRDWLACVDLPNEHGRRWGALPAHGSGSRHASPCSCPPPRPAGSERRTPSAPCIHPHDATHTHTCACSCHTTSRQRTQPLTAKAYMSLRKHLIHHVITSMLEFFHVQCVIVQCKNSNRWTGLYAEFMHVFDVWVKMIAATNIWENNFNKLIVKCSESFIMFSSSNTCW